MAAGAAPLGDIQTGFEAGGGCQNGSWGRVVLVNQPTISLAMAFLLPPSSLLLLSTGSCALIGTFLSQRPLTPRPHRAPALGRFGREDNKKTISIRGICGIGGEREEEKALTAVWWSQSIIITL